LKGSGDVGGEYPCKRVFNFSVRIFRDRGVTCNEAYIVYITSSDAKLMGGGWT